MKFSVEWPRPKDLPQRAEYAGVCVRDLGLEGCRLLLDDMDDSFNAVFKAWPTAYYVLRGSVLAYVGEPEPDSAYYDVKILLDKCRLFLGQ